jgi:hypothetical protein
VANRGPGPQPRTAARLPLPAAGTVPWLAAKRVVGSHLEHPAQRRHASGRGDAHGGRSAGRGAGRGACGGGGGGHSGARDGDGGGRAGGAPSRGVQDVDRGDHHLGRDVEITGATVSSSRWQRSRSHEPGAAAGSSPCSWQAAWIPKGPCQELEHLITTGRPGSCRGQSRCAAWGGQLHCRLHRQARTYRAPSSLPPPLTLSRGTSVAAAKEVRHWGATFWNSSKVLSSLNTRSTAWLPGQDRALLGQVTGFAPLMPNLDSWRDLPAMGGRREGARVRPRGSCASPSAGRRAAPLILASRQEGVAGLAPAPRAAAAADYAKAHEPHRRGT